MNYDTKVIRELILKALDAQTLKRLCLDEPLKPIGNKFGPGMGFDEMADIAINYCEQHVLMADLLKAIKRENPNCYRVFEPRLCRNRITSTNLQDIIFNLDRDDHIYLFKLKLRHVGNSAATFLVYGKPECGQDILVHHLIHLAAEGRVREQKVIPIHLGQRGVQSVEVSIARLWREMNRCLIKIGDSDPKKVIDNLVLTLETKDVIIILNDIGQLTTPNAWDTILKNFWHFIANKIDGKLEDCKARLLLIFVDWHGLTGKWDSCVDISTPKVDPLYPIQLPESTLFSKDDLKSWLDDIGPLLPASITIEELLRQTSNGLPYLVYDWICSVCETSTDQIFS